MGSADYKLAAYWERKSPLAQADGALIVFAAAWENRKRERRGTRARPARGTGVRRMRHQFHVSRRTSSIHRFLGRLGSFGFHLFGRLASKSE